MLNRLPKIVALLLALVPGIAFSAGPVELFTAHKEREGIRLDWKLSSHAPVDGFDLYRKRPDEATYQQLDNPGPPSFHNGQDIYTYTDELYIGGRTMTDGEQTGFAYKLVVRQGGSSETYLASVEAPTATQRSWGTIKAMFR